MAITITSLSPTVVPAPGGYKVEVVGAFVLGERLNAHIGLTGTIADLKAWSGIAGQGTILLPISATKLVFYTPRLPVSGAFQLFLKSLDSVDTALKDAAIETRAPQFYTSVFAVRGVLPPFYKTGPRRIDQVDPTR